MEVKKYIKKGKWKKQPKLKKRDEGTNSAFAENRNKTFEI